MEANTWTCSCKEQGTGMLPDTCPNCGDYGEIKLTEAGFRDGLSVYYHIHNRGLAITDLLGFGCDSLDFNGQDHFTTKWERRACSRGCCGYETMTEDIPTRYLWMSDTDIQAEVKAKKDAEVQAKAEADRQQKLREAQAQVAAAQARAATAQADAEKVLAKAAADLAALQKGA